MPLGLPFDVSVSSIAAMLTDIDASRNSYSEHGLNDTSHQRPPDVYLNIKEQPKNFMRMRTDSAAVIKGQNGGDTVSIQLMGYTGQAVVLMSLVTNEDSPRPHPNELWSSNERSENNDGCCFQVHRDERIENPEIKFSRLRLVTMKRQQNQQDVVDSLYKRKLLGVNPFKNVAENWNFTADQLDCVRICFEVIIDRDGRPFRLLALSQPIWNEKASGVKRMLAADYIEIERAIPQRIPSFPTFDLCLFTSKVVGASYCIWFKVEGQMFYRPISGVHRGYTIFIDDCHLDIPGNGEVEGQIFLTHTNSEGQPVVCSNEYQLVFERRKTLIDQDVNSRKRQRLAEPYSPFTVLSAEMISAIFEELDQ